MTKRHLSISLYGWSCTVVLYSCSQVIFIQFVLYSCSLQLFSSYLYLANLDGARQVIGVLTQTAEHCRVYYVALNHSQAPQNTKRTNARSIITVTHASSEKTAEHVSSHRATFASGYIDSQSGITSWVAAETNHYASVYRVCRWHLKTLNVS